MRILGRQGAQQVGLARLQRGMRHQGPLGGLRTSRNVSQDEDRALHPLAIVADPVAARFEGPPVAAGVPQRTSAVECAGSRIIRRKTSIAGSRSSGWTMISAAPARISSGLNPRSSALDGLAYRMFPAASSKTTRSRVFWVMRR